MKFYNSPSVGFPINVGFPLFVGVPFKKVFNDYRTGTKKKEYRISSKICRGCRFRESCLGKTAKEKKFSVTYYREEYERNAQRLASPKGRAMKSKRQSTVEPVFGTLPNLWECAR